MAEAPTPKRTVVDDFAPLKDPRIERTERHQLLASVVLALGGIICGAESGVEIEAFGKATAVWLKHVLALPNGIPSHDTFGRVVARREPQASQRCGLAWGPAMSDRTAGALVAMDGKTLRRSFDRAAGTAALHPVSAWACTNRLVLGQMETADHSNEITAIPALLPLLDLRGGVVTLDAPGARSKPSPARSRPGRPTTSWR